MPIFTTSDECSIHYNLEAAEHSTTPVVFLNGMTQTTRHWVSQVRQFRKTNPVVTYDARGQGKSDSPKDVPTLELHAGDLRDLLDHLEFEEADIVGFSHGARVAIGFATDHPSRLRRLVLCSATARPTALARTIVRSWLEVLRLGGLEALSWAALPTIVGPQFLEQNERLLANIARASTDRNSEEGVRLLLEGLAGFPPLDELAGKISAPTLVISATSDPLVTTEGAAELAEMCNGRHEIIGDCGHTIPIERPKEFRRLVAEFLS